MNGFHEPYSEHDPDTAYCECPVCVRDLKDFLREQDEDAMNALAAEYKQRKKHGST